MQPSTDVVIVASSKDAASLNIAGNLIRRHKLTPHETRGQQHSIYRDRNVTLIVLDKESIYVRPTDLPFEPSSVIFASKHRSSTETPALTVHATGNLAREASYGGNPEEVSMVQPFRIRAALMSLKRQIETTNLQIEVTMEATHHGPTEFNVPVCFVEIGSTPEEWSNPVLGSIVSNAIMDAVTTSNSGKQNAVGFGGTHYSEKLTQTCLASDYQIGHIVPRHAFDAELSERVLRDTFQKTVGLCKTAIVDWKGLKGEQRRHLLQVISHWDINVVRC